MKPFSLGTRNCVGKNSAWVEMRVILAKMLWCFDFTLATESAYWMDQKTYLIWAKHPFMVRLTQRKGK